MIEFGCHQTVVEWLDTDRFKGQDNPLDAAWSPLRRLYVTLSQGDSSSCCPYSMP